MEMALFPMVLWPVSHPISQGGSGGDEGENGETRQMGQRHLPFDLQFPVLSQILLAALLGFGNSIWRADSDQWEMVLTLRKTGLCGLF